MADLLRIATTGLLAYQGSLNTTGHNIANAGVEGYSRQRAELVLSLIHISEPTRPY